MGWTMQRSQVLMMHQITSAAGGRLRPLSSNRELDNLLVLYGIRHEHVGIREQLSRSVCRPFPRAGGVLWVVPQRGVSLIELRTDVVLESFSKSWCRRVGTSVDRLGPEQVPRGFEHLSEPEVWVRVRGLTLDRHPKGPFGG